MEELDLDKLPRRMPYTVPEGTFDAIEHSVLAAIAREQQAEQVAPIPPTSPPLSLRGAPSPLGRGVSCLGSAVLWR